MKDISRGGYTSQEIWDALTMTTGIRTVNYRFDLLNEKDQKKGELYKVISASISMDSLADLKRTAKFSLVDETETRTTGIRAAFLHELPKTLKEW